MERRRTSSLIHNKDVQARVSHINAGMLHRASPYPVRHEIQQKRLGLPLFPTTTIGSFPQTSQIRAARSEYKAGKRDADNYDAFLKAETEKAVRFAGGDWH